VNILISIVVLSDNDFINVITATSTVTKLDTLAYNCLDTLENKIPSIQKSPTQIVTNVKKSTSTAIHSGVRKVMKTYPGQQVVKGLDTLIQWSETTIETFDDKELTPEEKVEISYFM